MHVLKKIKKISKYIHTYFINIEKKNNICQIIGLYKNL